MAGAFFVEIEMENQTIRLYCPRCNAYLTTYNFKLPLTEPVKCKWCNKVYRYDGDKKIWNILWGYIRPKDSSGKRLN